MLLYSESIFHCIKSQRKTEGDYPRKWITGIEIAQILWGNTCMYENAEEKFSAGRHKE